MALLDSTSRARTTAQWMRENTTTAGFTKADLRAAVDATDEWIEDNTASFVAALPAGFRTNSTAAQKAWVFAFVLWRRIGRLRSEEDG